MAVTKSSSTSVQSTSGADGTSIYRDVPASSVSVPQQIVSSSTGAIVTALLMTPMDVVKIRLQQQHHPFPKGQCFFYHNGLMEHLCIPCENRQPCEWYQRPGNFSGTIDAFVKITRHEGIRSLWSGLSPTLVMAVPATTFYLTLYDAFLTKFRKALYFRRTLTPELFCPPDWSAALLAGATARAIAVTIVSPLEMIRTKMQSENLSYGDIGKALRITVSSRGLSGFYLGWMPTLLRDIPFSAVYWSGYETFKRMVLSWNNMQETTFLTSFLCGATAGTFAAVVTHPFDVIKTHLQIKLGQQNCSHRVTLTNTVKEIVHRGGGFGALFAGTVPRIVKIAPACATMIGSYEYFKIYFEHRNTMR